MGKRRSLDSMMVAYWSVVEGKFYLKAAGDKIKTNNFLAKFLKSSTKDITSQVAELRSLIEKHIFTVLNESEISAKRSKLCSVCELERTCRPLLHIDR